MQLAPKSSPCLGQLPNTVCPQPLVWCPHGQPVPRPASSLPPGPAAWGDARSHVLHLLYFLVLQLIHLLPFCPPHCAMCLNSPSQAPRRIPFPTAGRKAALDWPTCHVSSRTEPSRALAAATAKPSSGVSAEPSGRAGLGSSSEGSCSHPSG